MRGQSTLNTYARGFLLCRAYSLERAADPPGIPHVIRNQTLFTRLLRLRACTHRAEFCRPLRYSRGALSPCFKSLERYAPTERGGYITKQKGAELSALRL